MRRRIVAGNWKLHGDRRFGCALVEELEAIRRDQMPRGEWSEACVPPQMFG